MTTAGRRWQQWASFALGLALAVSPWLADYADYPAATANAAFLGLAIALLSHFQAASGEGFGEWLNLAAGLWCLAAPFYLGYSHPAATAASLCAGAFITALAGSALSLSWRGQDVHLR